MNQQMDGRAGARGQTDGWRDGWMDKLTNIPTDRQGHTNIISKLTVIWLSPVNLIVRVEETKYLNANSRLSLSKLSGASIGSLMALHIISAMSRALVLRSSLSGSLHKYLEV